MARADPAFRPNPNRAIFLSGEISQSTVDALTHQIISLTNASADPISVYIDSPGGSIFHADSLRRLLSARNQDGLQCRLITVATTQAASAAASFLSSGDYALAYPHTYLH